MTLERLLYDPALNALAPPVYQPYLAEAGRMCGGDVFLDHGLDVARRERVEVDGILYGKAMNQFKSQIPNPKSQLGSWKLGFGSYVEAT